MLNKWTSVSRMHFPFSWTQWLLPMEVFFFLPLTFRNGYFNIQDHLCYNLPYKNPFSGLETFLLPLLSERRRLRFLGYCLKSFITNEYSRCSLNHIKKMCSLISLIRFLQFGQKFNKKSMETVYLQMVIKNEFF